jgi:NAD+ synthase
MTKIDKITPWLADFAISKGFDGYVIGLSGGIDSAVSASLAVKALGKDKVLGILLPCTLTGERDRTEDVDLAKELANSLRISTVTVRLDTSAQALFNNIVNVTPVDGKLVLSNIKARLRMTTIRAYAEANHCLVLGTTNKTEEYLGYYTKAADGGAGVDVEPIADLFKYEVFQMARELGNIPIDIINRAPSAGLFDGQTDESEIGITYAEIDRYLEFREGITDAFNVERYENHSENMKMRIFHSSTAPKFENSVIDEIERRIFVNDHKRNNPPTIEL